MRALAVLAELWAASEIILLARHMGGDALLYTLLALLLLCCCALTYRFTFPPRGARESTITRQLLPIQLALMIALLAVTGWTDALHAHVVAIPVPVWNAMHRALVAALGAFTPSALTAAFANFVEYVVLPLALLAFLRVPLAKMGLGGFTRGSAGAAAIWLIVPIFAIAYLVLYADTSIGYVGQRLIYSFFASGFSEEFLFRGALFGRLRSFMPAQWAALVQALAFGLWRLGSDVAHGHDGIVTALALVVPAQAAFGFAMAILVRRTGNLAIPALLHTAIDAIRATV